MKNPIGMKRLASALGLLLLGPKLGFAVQTFFDDVQITTPDSPSVFLQQDGTGAFPFHEWVLFGNHTQFGIADNVSSTFPFVLEANAPDNSLVIKSNGNVGIGTDPQSKLHVYQDANTNAFITVQNPNSGTGAAAVVRSQSDSAVVNFQSHASTRMISRFGHTLGGWGEMLFVGGNGFAIGTLGDVPLVLGAANQERLRATSSGVEVFGTFTNSSSREYKEDIAELKADEALDAFDKLQPMKFKYKGQSEENLGFIAEDVPDLVAVEGRKSIAPMDFIALLTKVVQEQQKEMEQQQAMVEEQERVLASLGDQVAELERER